MKDEEDILLARFRGLSVDLRKEVIEFAESLATRADAARAPEPLPIERPGEETVVMAIRRLTRTYPMLDRRKLITETSRLIESHVLKGRDAKNVIDELEIVFSRHFSRTRSTDGAP